MRPRAVLFDRDGTLNELVYYERWGEDDSPASPDDVCLTAGAVPAIRRLAAAGIGMAIVSNQPGIAKGKFDRETFDAIDRRLVELLEREGAPAPPRFYCFHHPQALLPEYRVECDCRKPRPGLVLRASAALGIGLESIVLIGDTHRDIVAGRSAGCRTVLVGPEPDQQLEILGTQGLEPDLVTPDVRTAVDLLLA